MTITEEPTTDTIHDQVAHLIDEMVAHQTQAVEALGDVLRQVFGIRGGPRTVEACRVRPGQSVVHLGCWWMVAAAGRRSITEVVLTLHRSGHAPHELVVDPGAEFVTEEPF